MIQFVQATRPRHQWGAHTIIPAAESADGHERVVKACLACELKRITVIPSKGDPRRAYRFADGIEFERDTEPCCVGNVVTVEQGRDVA